MHISVTLLLCIFILCCTGGMRALSGRLRLQSGTVAAGSLLLAALSSLEMQIAASVSCNVASALFIAFTLLLSRRQHEMLVTVLLSFLCGALSWLLQRLFPLFFEPAVLLAAPSVILALLLPLADRQKLLCQALSPLFYGLIATLEEWYLFDIAVFSLGNAQQLDMQIVGAFLLLLLQSLPAPKAKSVLDMQKEY